MENNSYLQLNIIYKQAPLFVSFYLSNTFIYLISTLHKPYTLRKNEQKMYNHVLRTRINELEQTVSQNF